jgi:hypothetical protein
VSFDYANSAATATRLLTKFGRAMTHNSIAEGVYDPSTGTVTNVTTAQSGVGALLEYSTKEKGEHQQAGTAIDASTRKLLLSVSGITVAPKPADTVVFNSVTYAVLQVATLAPGGTPVLYECMVRK